MKTLLLSFSAVLFLSACSSTPKQDAPVAADQAAAQELEYPTGSNIARKKNTATVSTMTAEQAEEMKRNAQIRSPQSGSGNK